MLTNLLENPDSSDEIKEITITGLCKLVNARIVTDPKVLSPSLRPSNCSLTFHLPGRHEPPYGVLLSRDD